MGNVYCVLCGCVDQESIGVVERWGRFDRLAQPGLQFYNPFAGECLAGVLSTRICSLDVKIETKTKDNVFVQLHCTIQYRVIKENADDAFYELQNPREQIQSYVFDVVRAHVPRMSLDELFEQKNDVAQAVLEELEKCKECNLQVYTKGRQRRFFKSRKQKRMLKPSILEESVSLDKDRQLQTALERIY